MGLAVERICVCCLVIIVAKFMGFVQAGAKRCGGCLTHHLGVTMQVTKGGGEGGCGALFIGMAGSHCVILLYCETLQQVFLGIYSKRFYWRPLFTILMLLYVLEVGRAKS